MAVLHTETAAGPSRGRHLSCSVSVSGTA
jgi:hypothetical protein